MKLSSCVCVQIGTIPNTTHFEMSIESFVAKPTTETVDGIKYYKWAGFDVRWTKQKNLGVYATEDHPSNSIRLPYGGKLIVGAYTTDGQYTAQYDDVSYIDADPSLYPETAPRHAWIGSLVNEPCLGR